MSTADTIFALSSGAPPAAIAIIRISGPAAFDAVQSAGRTRACRRAARRLLILKHPEGGEVLDHALVLTFPGPDTASGEDLAELHFMADVRWCGRLKRVLAGLPGLRRAEPGEFTRRAFLNGRIDLNEAEGSGRFAIRRNRMAAPGGECDDGRGVQCGGRGMAAGGLAAVGADRG